MSTGGNKGAVFSKLVSISSSARSSGTTTNFIWNAGSNLQNVQRLSIPTCSFFNNFYNIYNDLTGFNNVYTYQYNANPIVTFTLTPGFYSISTLLNLMNADLTANAAGLGAWSFNNITNLVSLTVQTGNQITLNPGTNPPLGLMTSLGGLPFTTSPLVIAPIGTPTVLTGTTFPLLSSPTQVYLRSSTLSPGNSIDAEGRFSNTLLAIPVTAPPLNINLFECKVDSLCEIIYGRPRDLNRIDIQLTDRDGAILDLHGGTLNVELRVWFNVY
jgi:hypothetical protein